MVRSATNLASGRQGVGDRVGVEIGRVLEGGGGVGICEAPAVPDLMGTAAVPDLLATTAVANALATAVAAGRTV
jgi:hypothetical protein